MSRKTALNAARKAERPQPERVIVGVRPWQVRRGKVVHTPVVALQYPAPKPAPWTGEKWTVALKAVLREAALERLNERREKRVRRVVARAAALQATLDSATVAFAL